MIVDKLNLHGRLEVSCLKSKSKPPVRNFRVNVCIDFFFLG